MTRAVSRTVAVSSNGRAFSAPGETPADSAPQTATRPLRNGSALALQVQLRQGVHWNRDLWGTVPPNCLACFAAPEAHESSSRRAGQLRVRR